MDKPRAPRNRTLTLSGAERDFYRKKLLIPGKEALEPEFILNKTICADIYELLDSLPPSFADLLILDPPYNLAKNFHGIKFSKTGDEAYLAYLRAWFPRILKTLKPAASVYLCGDWRSASCLYRIMSEYAIVRSRITWQREKGRGAQANWKNTSEDIWFGTLGRKYYFDASTVKQKRRVIAPYTEKGRPKDWEKTPSGGFRLTYAGNFWDDITVPYWSMPENTDHPTQKPEKLMAKLILASCPPGGTVFDPFAGSGTSAVTAKKLGRNYVAVDINEEYCLWAEKRLRTAESDPSIQGYTGGVFWERNSLKFQPKGVTRPDKD
jgi:site-specific DNA-methyltransferase (adenine-specific)